MTSKRCAFNTEERSWQWHRKMKPFEGRAPCWEVLSWAFGLYDAAGPSWWLLKSRTKDWVFYKGRVAPIASAIHSTFRFWLCTYVPHEAFPASVPAVAAMSLPACHFNIAYLPQGTESGKQAVWFVLAQTAFPLWSLDIRPDMLSTCLLRSRWFSSWWLFAFSKQMYRNLAKWLHAHSTFQAPRVVLHVGWVLDTKLLAVRHIRHLCWKKPNCSLKSAKYKHILVPSSQTYSSWLQQMCFS